MILTLNFGEILRELLMSDIYTTYTITLFCAGTAVCPNTTTLARGQQRPTDPGRMPGEDGHLLGVFLKCTWAQRGKRFRKTLGIDSFADPGRRPGENGHLLGVFLKCT